jgi:hypothetical protein
MYWGSIPLRPHALGRYGRSGILPHQFEHQIKNHLVVAFRLRVQLVRKIGEEGLQAGQEFQKGTSPPELERMSHTTLAH